MPNLTKGSPPQPYGQNGRPVTLPMKATAQVYEGAMIAQVGGACCTATTAGSGRVIGVANHDQLGGATDGATRLSITTDKIFIFNAGVAAPTDATPFGAMLFCETDNTVGTGGLGNQREAGAFFGFEDDGRVRVFISAPALEAFGCPTEAVNGTALTDTAATTIQRVARFSRYLLAGTMSQSETVTFGTTGAVLGDIIRLVRTSVSAQPLAVNNGGAGAGTIATIPASKVGFVQAYFDGTNWLYDGSTPN